MSFTLQQVVPWGRTLEEYRRMFMLTTEDLDKRIASFGDGPASFQKEMNERGKFVHSYDPIYQFSHQKLEQRIEEVRPEVMEQVRSNMNNFVWNEIKNPEGLEKLRLGAMYQFLDDYESGKKEKRYRAYSLPDKLACEDQFYDIGLSSHFLLMYTGLGLDFHIAAMKEMLRVCKEVRIFPILSLNAEESLLTEQVINYFKEQYKIDLLVTDYEFQKGGNQLLRIRR